MWRPRPGSACACRSISETRTIAGRRSGASGRWQGPERWKTATPPNTNQLLQYGGAKPHPRHHTPRARPLSSRPQMGEAPRAGRGFPRRIGARYQVGWGKTSAPRSDTESHLRAAKPSRTIGSALPTCAGWRRPRGPDPVVPGAGVRPTGPQGPAPPWRPPAPPTRSPAARRRRPSTRRTVAPGPHVRCAAPPIRYVPPAHLLVQMRDY